MSVVVESFCEKKGGGFVEDVAGSVGLDWIRESEAFGSEVVIPAGLEEGDVAGIGCHLLDEDGCSLGEVGSGGAMKGDEVLSDGWSGVGRWWRGGGRRWRSNSRISVTY